RSRTRRLSRSLAGRILDMERPRRGGQFGVFYNLDADIEPCGYRTSSFGQQCGDVAFQVTTFRKRRPPKLPLFAALRADSDGHAVVSEKRLALTDGLDLVAN